jgi:zinc/manganese transport system substrate-binding protein
MSRLARAAGSNAVVVVTTRGIKERNAAGHGHGRGGTDAHAWQSVANAKLYVANIRDALVVADPQSKAIYEANAATYLAKLDDLDREVRIAVAAIPADRRKIITNHEAFGYFKQDYGVDFISLQGMSTEAEPSARDVARIITQIKNQKIPAVFLENITDARLMQRISLESGARIGGRLFSDALTDANGAAPSYIELMRHNVRTLAAALTS